jgi:hypothetical protein
MGTVTLNPSHGKGVDSVFLFNLMDRMGTVEAAEAHGKATG